MAKVTVTNLTEFRIGVPAPVNKVLEAHQSAIISLVSYEDLDRADSITALIDSGRISVSVGEDDLVDDTLELSPGKWQTITTFQNGWASNASSGAYAPACRVLPNRNVELRGALIIAGGGGSLTVMFTLPPECRPAGFVNLAVTVRDPAPLGWVAEPIFVDSNGDVSYLGIRNDAGLVLNIDGAFFSLE